MKNYTSNNIDNMAIVTIVIIITISMILQYCNTNNIDNIAILIILQLQASSNINDLTLLTIFKIYISNNIENMAMLGQKFKVQKIFGQKNLLYK